MKKKLALLLVAAMAVGTLAGCGDKGSSNSGSGAAGNILSDEEADPRFKYDEPVTLTSYFEISPAIAGDFDQEEVLNSVYYQRMTEETNISIDWQWFAMQTAEDSETKKSNAIAAADIPDFMIVNSAQLSLLAKTDNVINRNIGKIFEKYASEELMAWTTCEGQSALESATHKGEVIAIPLVDSSIDTLPVMWIRRDWIEKLGLKMPETMEELYEVMIAFRDQDPDGNGQDDTIGMVLHKNFLSTGLGDAVGLFNGFGAYPTIWVNDGNGKLMYGSIMEENKKALEYLAKMYQEGLIEKDFSSNDEVKASEAAASGRAGIQYGLMWNANWPLNATVQNDINADWVTIPLPSATGSLARPQTSPRITGYVVVSSKCEHPEAVVRLLNFWVDKYAYSGDEYNDYLVEDANGILNFPLHWVMLKTWYPLKNLQSHELLVKALEANDSTGLNAEQMVYWNDLQTYLSGDIIGGYGSMKTFGNDMSAYSTISYYYEHDLPLMNEFTTAPTPTMGRNMSTITDKENEYFSKVITGSESIDNWDAFVQEMNALGLDKITEELNEWYTSR